MKKLLLGPLAALAFTLPSHAATLVYQGANYDTVSYIGPEDDQDTWGYSPWGGYSTSMGLEITIDIMAGYSLQPNTCYSYDPCLRGQYYNLVSPHLIFEPLSPGWVYIDRLLTDQNGYIIDWKISGISAYETPDYSIISSTPEGDYVFYRYEFATTPHEGPVYAEVAEASSSRSGIWYLRADDSSLLIPISPPPAPVPLPPGGVLLGGGLVLLALRRKKRPAQA